MPQSIDSLIHARWVIPVQPADAVLENHALAIDDGRIVALVPSEHAPEYFEARDTHRLDNHAMLPGFVNAHTHAAMNLFKGLGDDLDLMEWLETKVWPAERQWIGPQFVRDGTNLAIAEMLRGGTTCFNDMYFFPDEVGKAASAAGIRAVVGMILIDAPTVWANSADEYIQKGTDVHDYFHGNPLVRTAFAPHAPYTVGDDSLKRIGVLAEELDIPVHIHLHETASEVEAAVASSGRRPIQRLDDLGLLSHRLVAVHMTQLTESELDRIAHCGASIVHCAESNLKLASGFCPLAGALSKQINVALGTDGSASNNDLDMIGEMRSAALLGKAVSGSAKAISARDVLTAATLGGAKALGLQDEIGSLAPGMLADVIAIDLNRIETQPCYDPVAQIVYAASRDQVTNVWVAGHQVLRNRQLTTLNEKQLLAQAANWAEKIQ